MFCHISGMSNHYFLIKMSNKLANYTIAYSLNFIINTTWKKQWMKLRLSKIEWPLSCVTLIYRKIILWLWHSLLLETFWFPRLTWQRQFISLAYFLDCYAFSLGGSHWGTVVSWVGISWVNHVGFPQERFEQEWECAT